MKTGIGSHTLAVRGQTDDWITPREIIDALGGFQSFDLDPCACESQPWPCAVLSLTRAQNGLGQPWPSEAAVWLNPPYGSETWRWLKKLAEHGNGTALVFAHGPKRRCSPSGFGPTPRACYSSAVGCIFIIQMAARPRATLADQAC